MMVNAFYIWRVWKISRNVWIVCLLFVINVARLAMDGIGVGVVAASHTLWQTFGKLDYVPLTIWGGVAVLADVSIPGVLVLHIRQYLSQELHSQVIMQILIYIVATGALTSLFSIVELLALLLWPRCTLYMAMTLVQIKVYSVSALLSLNLRLYRSRELVTSLNLEGVGVTIHTDPPHPSSLVRMSHRLTAPKDDLRCLGLPSEGSLSS